MGDYILGLDGGGTKTELAAAAPDGAELFRLRGGAINLNGETAGVVRQNLTELLRKAAEKTDGARCLALCIGAAGISNPEVEPMLRRAAEEAGIDGPIRIAGDHQTALYGALGSPRGVILIAGTGSICLGCDGQGNERRAGGRGHLIDDEGSGYAIGRDILRAVVRAEDGRAEPTAFTALVYEALEISDMAGLMAFTYRPGQGKGAVAALSALLPRGVERGDKAALAIVEKAAAELAALVPPVARPLGLEADRVALCGSVLQKDKAIRAAFEQRLREALPQISCGLPQRDAAAGAVLMARELLAASTGRG